MADLASYAGRDLALVDQDAGMELTIQTENQIHALFRLVFSLAQILLSSLYLPYGPSPVYLLFIS